MLWARDFAQDNTTNGGNNYKNGRWFFTLNGQQFTNIPIKAADGEIWRITNASGSATYDLRLWNPAQNQDMIFQVLSIDGVGISPTLGLSQHNISEIVGSKVQPRPCPGVAPTDSRYQNSEPLCTTRLLMMPSTRTEIWVA